MRETYHLVIVFLYVALPIAVHSQQQETGLQFLDQKQYQLIPKAKEVVSGSGVVETPPRGETAGTEKLLIPELVKLEEDLPSAQNQGLTTKACAAFAVTSNKAYRIYIASGKKGSPNDYLQSPGFPYSAACRRRVVIHNGQCVASSFITDELDFLSEVGSLPLKDMPYRQNVCEDWESHLLDGKNKSSAPYTALPSAPNSQLALAVMKNLLAGGNPIIMGFNACKEFYFPVNGYITQVDRSKFECKAHAVLVVGYDTPNHLIRIFNSWGGTDDWKGSDNGKAWMSEEVFLERYREGYIDQGPGQVTAYAGSYTELAHSKLPANGADSAIAGTGASAQPPIQESPSLVITPDVLKASLRASVGKRVGKTIVKDRDDGTYHTVNRRYLWLDIPEQYANQVQSVTYHLIDDTFVPFTTTKYESSIFLVWWKGWGCVDQATVSATLIDPSLNYEKPVEAQFNYCNIADDQQRPSKDHD